MSRISDRGRLIADRIINGIKKTVIVLFLIFCITGFFDWATEGGSVWKPDYSKVDLEDIVSKESLTDEDYHTIMMQTGLGKDAADKLLSTRFGEFRVKTFEQYQDNFFAPEKFDCRVYVVIVHDERMVDQDGNDTQGFEIADLRDGDILITKATHSLGWRHGHAAIVTDAEQGETIEAILLGNPVMIQHTSKWRTYPSFIQLRLKDKNADPEKIAVYARKELLGVPYGLFAGIPVKAPEHIKDTQCAHVVWYPFKHFGYDLDSDGSWLVTPKDIANSDLLEVVQVYGVDPENIWP